MTFQYKVRDPLGKLHEGTVEASSLEDATQQLRREGFQVLELQEGDGDLGSLFPRRVTRAEIMYATNQLAVMVDTGISLSAALQGIFAQEQNPTLRKVLKDLNTSVEGGEDFSKALGRYPHLFDRTYISLVKASEATGLLGPMLERVSTYLRKEIETRGKVRAAMAYPTVMLVLAVFVTIFLLTFVMPKFTPLFSSKGMKLPTPTIVMMVISDSLLNYWWGWIAGSVAAVAGFIISRRTPGGRMFWDRLKIDLPLLGPMNRKVIISRSIRTLGTMLSSGIPVLDALELAAEVAGNYYYEKLWRSVSDRVVAGDQVCDSLSGSPLFPPMLVQMISAGEQTGKLGGVLERVSNYYDQEVETSLKAVTSIIEPIMISVMGVIVGTIGLALLLPVFSLSKAG
jgi:type IV pilus assembly protein PilC